MISANFNFEMCLDLLKVFPEPKDQAQWTDERTAVSLADLLSIYISMFREANINFYPDYSIIDEHFKQKKVVLLPFTM